jgi:hypothetical protein
MAGDYEAPRVDELTPVSAPLNQITSSELPIVHTPVWRTNDDER